METEEPAAPKTLSQKDFAARRRVRKGTVSKWKAKGFLVLDGDSRVLVEETEAKLAQQSENYRGGTTHRPASLPAVRAKPSGGRKANSAVHPSDGAPDPADFGFDDPNLPTAEAVRRKENFLGLLRKHELAVARGLYVRKADVVAHIARAFAGFRQAVQRMPSRHVPETAARLGVEPGALEVELDRMIAATLGEMSAPLKHDFISR